MKVHFSLNLVQKNSRAALRRKRDNWKDFWLLISRSCGRFQFVSVSPFFKTHCRGIKRLSHACHTLLHSGQARVLRNDLIRHVRGIIRILRQFS